MLVSALVDSGADLCVVPAALAQHLDLPLTDVLRVSGVGGAMRSATVHAAAIDLAGRRGLVEVVALGDEMLVGRNYLPWFVATLDGPQEQLAHQPQRARRVGEEPRLAMGLEGAGYSRPTSARGSSTTSSAPACSKRWSPKPPQRTARQRMPTRRAASASHGLSPTNVA